MLGRCGPPRVRSQLDRSTGDRRGHERGAPRRGRRVGVPEMRILVANYRYFVSSGPERYMFNVMGALARKGHEVMPFSVSYARNVPTPYARYFVRPLGREDEVFFDQHRTSPDAFLRTLSRLFYSREVEVAAMHMAEETRPDVAYVLCYLRKLSPSLLVGLKKKGIPIVVRLSDYGMFCPEHHCLRDSSPCTLCLSGNLLNSISNRCVKGSFTISALDALSTWFHRHRRFFDCIDVFVTTNPFMSEMMVKAGYDEERLFCIPTFTDVETFRPTTAQGRPPDYAVYVGRLDRPKGAHVLIDAAAGLRRKSAMDGFKIKLAGTGHDQRYVDLLHSEVRRNRLGDSVEFLGDVDPSAVPALLRNALFAVVPSIWYENLPNTLLESLASGTPIVASNIGSLAVAIRDEIDGLLFEPGNAGDLAAKMDRLLVDDALRMRMSTSCRERAVREYSPEAHVTRLLALFKRLACDAGRRNVQGS